MSGFGTLPVTTLLVEKERRQSAVLRRSGFGLGFVLTGPRATALQAGITGSPSDVDDLRQSAPGP